MEDDSNMGKVERRSGIWMYYYETAFDLIKLFLATLTIFYLVFLSVKTKKFPPLIIIVQLTLIWLSYLLFSIENVWRLKWKKFTDDVKPAMFDCYLVAFCLYFL